MVRDVTSEVARRYFWLRKEHGHKKALGLAKEEFNLPLHFVMGFNDLQETFEKWKKGKRRFLEIPYLLTDEALRRVCKKISLLGLEIIDSQTHQIVGQTIRYTAEIVEGKIQLKFLCDEKGRDNISLICQPYDDFQIDKDGKTYHEDLEIIAIELE